MTELEYTTDETVTIELTKRYSSSTDRNKNMEKVETIPETKHYIKCPHCDKGRHQICHLFDSNHVHSWGTWYCDECGGGFKGQVDGRDVYVEKVDQRKDDCNVFLKHGDILLVVKGMYFDGNLDLGGKRYYYEEHTCPTNYFHDVEMVIDLRDKNTDPHGIFEFIGAIPYVAIRDMDYEKIKETVQDVLENATRPRIE